jgi:hypothetical protein
MSANQSIQRGHPETSFYCLNLTVAQIAFSFIFSAVAQAV